MKIRLAAGAAAMLALAACGGQNQPAADAPAEPASSAASSDVVTAPPATPARGEVPNKEFVTGKWGTDGDCTLAIDLRPDGTSDGPFGVWSYNDGVISFPEEPDFKVTVTIVDGTTMESTNADGNTAKMTRCP
jgi:hypothetical protein